MADPKKHTAHINRKGLDGLLDEDVARAFATRLGSRRMMLIEVRADSKTVDEDGNENVALVIDAGDVVPDELEDNFRSVQRALYLQRPERRGDKPLAGTTPEQSVGDAATALDAQLQRDDDGNVVGIWEGAGKKATRKRAAKKAAVPDPENSDAEDAALQADPCEFPGCRLVSEHDGDHDVPEGVTT